MSDTKIELEKQRIENEIYNKIINSKGLMSKEKVIDIVKEVLNQNDKTKM